MLSLSSLLQVLLAAVVARCIYLHFFHPLARYPGPLLASVVNLWKFLTFFGGEHHLVEMKLHAKYGPVVRIGPRSLAFSSLSAFDAIYGFNKHIEKEAHSAPKETWTMNIAPSIHRYTFDTTAALVFGESLSSQPYTDTKSAGNILIGFRNISKMAWGTSLLPLFGWLMSTRPMSRLTRRPTFDEQGNLTSIAAMIADTRDLALVHPEKAVKAVQPSVLKNFLQVPKEDTTHMSPDQIWRECFNLMIAGPGSTAAALTAVLYRLGSDQGRYWQDRIRADVSEEDSASVSTSSPVLVAVIKETLRLHAPFPTAFPRSIAAGAETVIPDLPTPLPIGTLVSSNTYILGHSKEIWGDDAESWKPQR
ncbi:hypothetical protein MMC07_003988 [Pseudocyphellaria aurata]|nr:hypothetical protein [Pseudocyphellaria aurata]